MYVFDKCFELVQPKYEQPTEIYFKVFYLKPDSIPKQYSTKLWSLSESQAPKLRRKTMVSSYSFASQFFLDESSSRTNFFACGSSMKNRDKKKRNKPSRD